MGIGKVERQAEFPFDLCKLGELPAVVCGHCTKQTDGQILERFDCHTLQRRRLFVQQNAQSHVSTLAFDERGQQASAFGTFNRIGFPITKAFTLLNCCRSLFDADTSGNLSTLVLSASGVSGVSWSPSFSWFAKQFVPTVALFMSSVDPLVDRFVRDMPGSVTWMFEFESIGDLLW